MQNDVYTLVHEINPAPLLKFNYTSARTVKLTEVGGARSRYFIKCAYLMSMSEKFLGRVRFCLATTVSMVSTNSW